MATYLEIWGVVPEQSKDVVYTDVMQQIDWMEGMNLEDVPFYFESDADYEDYEDEVSAMLDEMIANGTFKITNIKYEIFDDGYDNISYNYRATTNLDLNTAVKRLFNTWENPDGSLI